MDNKIATMPKPKIPVAPNTDRAAGDPGAFLDMESDLIDLVHMANIAFDLMQGVLYGRVRDDGEGRISVQTSADERERFAFAVGNAASRADALKAQFKAACGEVRS
ncbi:MAG: hypothetical protein KL863_07550 [Rhizobium sp.]|nr:hypothetical protein [Rhizobium sp.]